MFWGILGFDRGGGVSMKVSGGRKKVFKRVLWAQEGDGLFFFGGRKDENRGGGQLEELRRWETQSKREIELWIEGS